MNRCPSCDCRDIVRETCSSCGFAPTVIDGFSAFAPLLARGNEGFDPAHHHVLAALEECNFWFRGRNQLIVDAARRYAPGMSSFLEIGCGTGFVLAAIGNAFPGASLAGSELFPGGLKHAAERLPAANFVQMDARAIPYSACFDAVGLFDVVEHIEEDLLVLQQAHEALVEGGTLFLTVPQHQWLWSEQDEIAHHVRRYSRHELLARMRESGFETLRITSFVSLLLPLMLLSRKRRKAGSVQHDPFHEFRMPRWLDSLLYAAMRVEAAAIKAGVSFPVGGSLLLVARKRA